MFNPKTPVVFFQKEKIIISLVKLGKTPQIIKSDSTGWDKDSLTATFSQIKAQLKVSQVRLLLSDALSYVLTLSVPKTADRTAIAELIKTQIPELLESSDWDYKATGKTNQQEQEIICFAPVKATFQLLSEAAAAAGLTFAAVEPESIAKLRHPDPIIGLALKEDLTGKDDQVLNISAQPQSKPRQPLNTKPFLIGFLILLIIAIIAGGIITSQRALTSKPSPSLTLGAVGPSPSPLPEFSPSPEPELVLSDYQLLVLNGTGGKGVAAAAKAILLDAGFARIKADNAEAQTFTQTEIQLKPSAPEKLYTLLFQALNSSYEVTRSAELLTPDSDYDVVISVGNKKE